MRTMTFLKYREETRQLFNTLRMMNIYELNQYFIALFMFKFTITIHDQPQKYRLVIRGLIMENSPLSTGKHKFKIICRVKINKTYYNLFKCLAKSYSN